MSKKAKQPDQWKYAGFSKPESNFFKMPNDWTNITAKITSLAELKVIEYVLRHTWGFQEFGIAKKITTDEFMKGRKLKDGNRIDDGTGLSNRSIIDGLRRAVAHGFLVESVDDRDKARVKKYYMLNMRPLNGDEEENNPDMKNLHTGVKEVHIKGEQTSQRSEKETIETNLYVVKRLLNLKISKEKANELSYRYSSEYIVGKIELLEWKQAGGSVGRPIKDPAAWLIRAIEKDYIPPKGFANSLESKGLLEAAEQAVDESELAGEYKNVDPSSSVWATALEELQLQFSRQFFDTWLQNTRLIDMEKEVATIGVANKFAQEQLTKSASGKVASVLSGLLDERVEVRFEVFN